MTTRIALLFALCAVANADTITATSPADGPIFDNFSLIETWTVSGGTGSGVILIVNLPPFAFGDAEGDPDDALGAIAQVKFLAFGVTYLSSTPGAVDVGPNAAFPFTFGVPFSFTSAVQLYAQDSGGLGVGVATADYGPGSGTYQIPAVADMRAGDSWEFLSDANPNLSSVTLERSAVFGSLPAAPEPNLIWACLAGLVVIGIGKRRIAANLRSYRI